jgi:Tol biopolymer transport system component
MDPITQEWGVARVLRRTIAIERSNVIQSSIFLILIATIAVLVALRLQVFPTASAQDSPPLSQAVELPTVPDGDLLLFASVNPPALLAAPASSLETGVPIPADQIQQLIQWGAPIEDAEPLPREAGLGDALATVTPIPEEVESGHDGLTKPGPLLSSPDGRYAAVQLYPGPMAVALLVDFADRSRPVLSRLGEGGFGRFLGWHPDSRHALYLAFNLMVPDPGLWIVDVIEGTHRRIETPGLVAPEGLTAAAFSPDGTTIAYATHGGMGTGSEIWTVQEGSEPQKLWSDKVTVVGSLLYSPDGQYIAFNNLLDSPVPFAKSGLWVIEAESEQASFLTVMDGGHGQQPLWSRDSTELYFVRRDNLDDTTADYKAEALVSSIRAFRLAEREERELASSDGARQVDLSLTPAGELLFASNRGGVAELWAVSPDGNLRPVTDDGNAKRHPLIVSPAAQTQP